MEEVSTVYVGLDVHAQSTAIAVAHAGREAPRFVGTVGARLSELIKLAGFVWDLGHQVTPKASTSAAQQH
ncbi:MAG TPA: hypothetical protein VLJ19_19535 [Variovorax sp.]|nr:hypothetical protein [Variovorax sp.]